MFVSFKILVRIANWAMLYFTSSLICGIDTYRFLLHGIAQIFEYKIFATRNSIDRILCTQFNTKLCCLSIGFVIDR